MTAVLATALLVAAWLLGQLPTAAKRLAIAFGASALGASVVRLATDAGISEMLIAGVAGVGAAALAWWLMQPWLWGLEDWFAELDAELDAEREEQP